jgi:hypothetical protein
MTFPEQQRLPLTLGALAVRYAFALSQVELARAEIAAIERDITAKRQTIAGLLVRIKEGEEEAKTYWTAIDTQLDAARKAEAA